MTDTHDGTAEALRGWLPREAVLLLASKGHTRRHAQRLAVYRLTAHGLPTSITRDVSQVLRVPYDQLRDTLTLRDYEPSHLVSSLGRVLYDDPFAFSAEWM